MLKKKKTAGSSAKKPTIKKAVKKTVKKSTAKAVPPPIAAVKPILPPEEIQLPPAKKYITINEFDPELQKKRRLMLIILALAVVFLAVSWFFALRNNVAETVNSFRSGQMRTEIDNLMSRLRNDDTERAEINQRDLDIIKEEIIQKINESSLATSTWPIHQSEILGLQLSYPANWNKQEITDTLTLSSYPLTGSAPSVFGQIKIKRLADKKDSLEKYLAAEQQKNYEIDPALTELSGLPAIKYIKKDTGADISWIVIAGAGNRIYQIELYSKHGQGLYEKLFSEILGTIKLQ